MNDRSGAMPSADGALARAVSLDRASAADEPLLSNLLELYIHDLSRAFPEVELGPDGRFGYPKLALYLSEPESHFAFLIRSQGRLSGFVLATRGSPVVEDPNVLDIAEFFVIRGQRRKGVGRAAAQLLWRELPGRWVVRVSEENPAALAFWRGIIAEFTNGTMTESIRPSARNAWRVFRFESTA
ncbi:MAG TPA: GNAT family N-acetyltransferase [Polyangiaceae bacterium]